MKKFMELKQTVFLPKTQFPMQGKLPQNDPIQIQKWQQENLYLKLREISKNRKKFILHFGPPYANGHIHMGHVLTGVLKDIINKCYQMSGYDAPLVLGWDCHGLPIEWKIEETYLKKGIKRENVPIEEFLNQCRTYATQWRDIQKEEFKNLGMIFDYDNPYCTMNKETEVTIYQEFLKILKSGNIYRDKKPVMWSVVEKTALAEAEIEYKDKVSDAIYVSYPIIKTNNPILNGAYAVIWTTTPWTIPASKAIAYNEEFEYVLVEIQNKKLLIAQCRLDALLKELNTQNYQILSKINNLHDVICAHPLVNLGFNDNISLLPAAYVTNDTGTGLVHTAPGHGLDDFYLGKKFNLNTECTVNEDGTLKNTLPHFGGEHVFKVNSHVIEELQKANNLICTNKITHSYPHSWRSKTPLIFRTTTQWFIAIDKIRNKLLEEVKQTKWVPENYINRIFSMIEKRPDWCISRQRVWGVPISVFINKKTNDVLMDDDVFNRIISTFEQEGIESWYTKSPSYFLGDKYSVDDFIQVKDTLEVWFDSGCSHKYVLQNRPELTWPADLYLEGSDQHRGWFQSSLIESVLTTGKAPYKQVATNGFLLDQNGYKMSKSQGNVINPTDITSKYGVDVLRLWCVNCDYTEDIRIGEEIMRRQQDMYRRFRNTLRYLLGCLSDYDKKQEIPYNQLPTLEKLVLHKLYKLNLLLGNSISNLNLQKFYTELHTFCSNDLSAFYFDIRKDSIYCDSKDNVIRQSAMTVINYIFLCLIHWLAPVLSITAEEAYRYYPLKENDDSIHLHLFQETPEEWNNNELEKEGEILLSLRSSITSALEEAREKKIIGSSLEAAITVYVDDIEKYKNINLTELAIVSQAELKYKDNKNDIEVIVNKANGTKCLRCWKFFTDSSRSDLCPRCCNVVEGTVS